MNQRDRDIYILLSAGSWLQSFGTRQANIFLAILSEGRTSGESASSRIQKMVAKDTNSMDNWWGCWSRDGLMWQVTEDVNIGLDCGLKQLSFSVFRIGRRSLHRKRRQMWTSDTLIFRKFYGRNKWHWDNWGGIGIIAYWALQCVST